MSVRVTLGTARCPRCDRPLLPVVMGMPVGDVFEQAQRGEVLLGGCVLAGPTPDGVVWLGCERSDWFGGLWNGRLLDERTLIAHGELENYRWRWQQPDVAIGVFDEIGERLTQAQEADQPEVIAILGPPALRALEQRFGVMNEAFHNIGWYVGEMYYVAEDRRGLPVMAKTERVLAALEGPDNEVRLDVLAQQGWLAGRFGHPRLAYRSLRERFDLLENAVGPDDPEVFEARELAREAACRAGYSVVAAKLASDTSN